MMALWRRALLGAGVVAAPRRPARRAAVRAVSTARGRRGCAAVGLGGTWELPPQRDSGRSLSSCVAAAAGLAAVAWWGLPRLYGGAHTKTTQMDRHGQGPRVANGCGPGPFGPSITFSLVALFVSCDDGDGDEVEREPAFLLLMGGGAGWDRQTDRSEMLPMMYDSTLGD